jgi:UDP-2,3-diacylglucosamine hydrolase
MRRLLLSDVHLSPRHPDRTRSFLDFLGRQAPGTGELYVLGDLFDYWIGPKHLDLPDYREALEALRDVGARGTRVVFFAGNRDFYLSRRFREFLGAQVVHGALDVTFASGRVHLCHGDRLCTRDRATRRAQAVIRSALVEAVFTRLPVRLARFLAEGYRAHSRRVTPGKPARHVALDDRAVLEVFRGGADVIVCGHTHRATKHTWRLGGRDKVLFSLGDWADGPSYLVEEQGTWHLYGAG